MGRNLAVTRRAERFYQLDGGRLPAPSRRLVNGDAGLLLKYQGIAPGRSIEGRLQDVRLAAAHGPQPDETAIELPFRLTLSPSQEGRFRTPQPVPPGVFVAHRAIAVDRVLGAATRRGRCPCRSLAGFPSRRVRPGGVTPLGGPWAPWALAGEQTGGSEQLERFRTSLDASDRHELVGLSSVYGLPVLGRYNENRQVTDGSQFAPPSGYGLKNLLDSKELGDQSAV